MGVVGSPPTGAYSCLWFYIVHVSLQVERKATWYVHVYVYDESPDNLRWYNMTSRVCLLFLCS